MATSESPATQPFSADMLQIAQSSTPIRVDDPAPYYGGLGSSQFPFTPYTTPAGNYGYSSYGQVGDYNQSYGVQPSYGSSYSPCYQQSQVVPYSGYSSSPFSGYSRDGYSSYPYGGSVSRYTGYPEYSALTPYGGAMQTRSAMVPYQGYSSSEYPLTPYTGFSQSPYSSTAYPASRYRGTQPRQVRPPLDYSLPEIRSIAKPTFVGHLRSVWDGVERNSVPGTYYHHANYYRDMYRKRHGNLFF